MMTKNDDLDFAQDDTLGGRISLAREAARLTMAQAARRLGVQTASWNAWECDRASPRSNRLTMMAGLLGVSPSWLLTGMGAGPRERPSSEVKELLRELRAASALAVSSQQRVDGLLARLEHHGQRLATA
ncbi:helix-turn-helix domain-containing protein [Rhizobiaceae sp. 2RAB30]